MRRRSGRRALHWLEGLLLVTGLICFGWFGYNWLASAADQLWSNYELDARISGEAPTIRGFFDRFIHPQSRPLPSPPAPGVPSVAESIPEPTAIESGENIGRIEIPRLDISTMLRQGTDDETLSRAAGHVPWTALPGEEGNVGIAAHRDSYFRNLRNVREGDLIRVTTPGGTYEYKVESTKIVMPTDVEVLDPTPQRSVTLVTCYPFYFIGHAPKRFIVRARQVEATNELTEASTVPAKPKPTAAKRRS